MTNLRDARPPATSIHADPLSFDEIDAHPGRDCIWATLSAFRDEIEQAENWSFFGEEAG